MTNEKLIDRIQKLLRLARDGGATEAEADTAMRMAQEIMEENNLTLATIEASGGKTGEEGERQKEGMRKRAMYPYQRNLMSAISEINYCYVTVISEYRGKAYRKMGYNIIGRKSNVVATQTMFDYLTTSINRIVLEHLGGDHKQRMSRYALSFCDGMSDRLIQRLYRRHKDYLDNQKREADERRAAANHPAAAPSNSLVVVMHDYAQAERDLNQDFRYGWAPGTTAANRVKEEEKSRERAKQKEKLIAEGIDPEVADWMVWGHSREEAERICAPKKPETEKQRRHREEKERRRSERFWRSQYNKEDRRDHTGYRAGIEAAENVGLDPQVQRRDSKRIGS